MCHSHPAPHDRGFEIAGRLTGEVLDDAGIPTDADFYLCGPGPFMHDIAAVLAARGVAPERISTEVFGPADAITPGVVTGPLRSPHPLAGVPGAGPSISFSRSNLSVAWDPSFSSLLELAEACDVPVRWACRTGVCHTCETGLVSGEISYRPDPLEPSASGHRADLLLTTFPARSRSIYSDPEEKHVEFLIEFGNHASSASADARPGA